MYCNYKLATDQTFSNGYTKCYKKLHIDNNPSFCNKGT